MRWRRGRRLEESEQELAWDWSSRVLFSVACTTGLLVAARKEDGREGSTGTRKEEGREG